MSPPELPDYIVGALKALGSGNLPPKEVATLAIPANGHGQYHVAGHSGAVALNFFVDTGAASVFLRDADAQRLGIRVTADDYTVALQTANGPASAAPVTLPWLNVGGIFRPQVAACVMPDHLLFTNLLGMTFLSRLRHVEIRGGVLTLTG